MTGDEKKKISLFGYTARHNRETKTKHGPYMSYFTYEIAKIMPWICNIE